MATWIYVKSPSAPAGSIKLSAAGQNFVIDDGSNTTITTTDPTVAAHLASQPLLMIQGTPGAPTPSPSRVTDVSGTLTDGRKTVPTPGTAVALRASLPCRWVKVTALPTNTQPVAVGGAGVLAAAGTLAGTPLAASVTLTIEVSNAASVFVDARVAGEGVSFTVGS